MGCLRGFRRRRKARMVWLLALYALLVAVNPVLHDDLACHLKSPTHCSACAASPSAVRLESAAPLLPAPAAMGVVEVAERDVKTVFPILIVAGRSPPA
jgi:hypothetical protein